MSVTIAETPLLLDETWASRVRGGAPAIRFEEVEGLGEGRQDGEAIPLADPSGARLGFGVVDADGTCLRVLPAARDEGLDVGFFRQRVRRALGLREWAGVADPEGAFRWIHGEGDGLAGLFADFYAGHVLVYGSSDGMLPIARLLAAAIESEIGPASIVYKTRPAAATPVGRVPFTLLAGSEPPPKLVVREKERRYEVHLLGGINTGLFADMREVREALRPWCAERTVLNTFCYTGSFSVVAAKAGARSVVSVDFAAGVLEWAKTNFHLNDLAAESPRFRFVRDDVFEFLKKERRKQRQYDVVILDPPPTTTVPGRRWYLKSDYDRLAIHALKVLSPGGLLVAAASSQESRPEGLLSQLRSAGRESDRRLRLLAAPGQPPDFPTPLLALQTRHLKCFFLQAE